MSPTMSREEREAFLAGVHVGVLSVASLDGGGPLAVPAQGTAPGRGPAEGRAAGTGDALL